MPLLVYSFSHSFISSTSIENPLYEDTVLGAELTLVNRRQIRGLYTKLAVEMQCSLFTFLSVVTLCWTILCITLIAIALPLCIIRIIQWVITLRARRAGRLVHMVHLLSVKLFHSLPSEGSYIKFLSYSSHLAVFFLLQPIQSTYHVYPLKQEFPFPEAQTLFTHSLIFTPLMGGHMVQQKEPSSEIRNLGMCPGPATYQQVVRDNSLATEPLLLPLLKRVTMSASEVCWKNQVR